jgi:surface protein
MTNMFYNCQSLKQIDLKCFESSINYPIDMSYLFYYCSNLTEVILNFNTFYVSDMKQAFYDCISLNVVNLEALQTKENNFIDVSNMFYNCNDLESISFSNWTQSFGVSNMKNMFYNCNSLKQLDLKSFESSNNYFIDMSNSFYNCFNLTQVIGTNNSFYISDGNNMFHNCTSLISINLSTFETKPNNFIDLSNMFYNCSKLESVSFTPIYQSFGVNNMQNMFYNCNSLININLNSFNSSIDNYVNMSYIFYNCYNLNHVKIDFEIFYILDGKEMFYNCYSLKSIKLDSLKTKKDSNDFIDISNMFYNCSNIESITFNSSSPDFGVKDMQNMFYNCLSLKYVDLSSLNSSYDYNINMSRLFYNFTFLEKADGFINDFYINDTTEMFYNCTSLKSINLVRFQTNEDIFIN